jgi:hypothetical protein
MKHKQPATPAEARAQQESRERQKLAIQRQKRPDVLRISQRELFNIESRLQANGYRPGDEVFEQLRKLLAAVSSDLDAIAAVEPNPHAND